MYPYIYLHIYFFFAFCFKHPCLSPKFTHAQTAFNRPIHSPASFLPPPLPPKDPLYKSISLIPPLNPPSPQFPSKKNPPNFPPKKKKIAKKSKKKKEKKYIVTRNSPIPRHEPTRCSQPPSGRVRGFVLRVGMEGLGFGVG